MRLSKAFSPNCSLSTLASGTSITLGGTSGNHRDSLSSIPGLPNVSVFVEEARTLAEQRHFNDERDISLSSVQNRGTSSVNTDEEEFSRFVDEVLPKLWRLIRHSAVPAHEVEDVAAQALARAFASWSRIRNAPYRDGWVLRATANLVYDRLRRDQRRRLIAPAEELRAPGFEDALVDRAVLTKALRALTRRQRQAIALRYWADLEVDDVARAMKLSPTSVRTHLTRAKAALAAGLPNGQRGRDD